MTYLAGTGMKHPYVLAGHDMNQLASFDVSYLNETRLEGKNVGVIQSKCLWSSFPGDLPVLSSSPPIPIDEETEVRIVEQELAVKTLNMNWLDIFFSCDEVKGRVCLVEK